jgi:hypothetical protein
MIETKLGFYIDKIEGTELPCKEQCYSCEALD